MQSQGKFAIQNKFISRRGIKRCYPSQHCCNKKRYRETMQSMLLEDWINVNAGAVHHYPEIVPKGVPDVNRPLRRIERDGKKGRLRCERNDGGFSFYAGGSNSLHRKSYYSIENNIVMDERGGVTE